MTRVPHLCKTATLATIFLCIGTTETFAALSFCSDTSPFDSNGDGLSVSDMTFQGSAANDCYGVVSGNDGLTGQKKNPWPDGTSWTELAKDDGPGTVDTGTVFGVTFDLLASSGTSGTWTLEWEETGTPGFDLEMDVVAVLKGSQRFASYLFEDLLFTSDLLSGAGTWSIEYFNNGGNIPGLSHLTLYRGNADGGLPPDDSSDDVGDPNDPSQVPVPAPLALIGLGGLVMAWTQRRKHRTSEW